MAMFDSLIKEKTASLKITVTESVNEILKELAKKYGTQPNIIAAKFLENSKLTLKKELNPVSPNKTVNKKEESKTEPEDVKSNTKSYSGI